MKQLSGLQGIGLLIFVINLCLTLRLTLEGIPQIGSLFMVGFGLMTVALQTPETLARIRWLLPLYFLISLFMWATHFVLWHWW
jgi:hypothetical protein